MTITLYGIPNCDTVKKARAWLDARGVPFQFHDYKKAGADRGRLETWIAAEGWETILNRRGTTFRGLGEEAKSGLDAGKAATLMEAHPSTIKRPVVEYAGGLLVGFNEQEWERALL
jgi:Spx/MgsR family transcriptional regulator